MKRQLRVKKLWIAGLASVIVGAAFLLAWQLTRERLPDGAILVPRDAPTLAAALELAEPDDTIVLDARRSPFDGGVSVDVHDITIRSTRGRALLHGESNPIISIIADGVTVTGLALQGTGVGIHVVGSGCRIAETLFESLAVAVLLAGGTRNVVEESILRDGEVGVDVLASGTALRSLACSGMSDVAVRARSANGCRFEELAIESCAAGILFDEVTDASLLDTSVRRAGTGIDVSGGTGVSIDACTLSTLRVGVQLRAAEDVSVAHCEINGATDAGVTLEGARRARVVETTFRGCERGIRSSGAGESSLRDNTFLDCTSAAIVLQGGEDDLVSGNVVRGGDVGIRLERAASAQLLRNSVADALLVGVLFDRADHVQLLDTRVRHCDVGIAAAASSDVTIRRCSVDGSEIAGIVFLNGTLGNVAADNRIADAGTGVLAAGSSRDRVMENAIARCAEGLALCRTGYGMRLEGNDVGDCGVGLSWSDETCVEEAPLARLGFSVERSASVGVPLVADNVFRGCHVADVRNDTDTPLLVGGNRWSSDTARVEGNVRVPDFGWTGTVSLGTSTSAPDLILGRLLQWMLLEEGVRVVDLVGLGSEDEIARAFDRGDLDAAWCSETAAAAPGDAFWGTSLARGWLLVVTAEAAERQISVDVAAPNEVPRDLVAASLERAGLTARSVRSVATSAEAEHLLKFGTVECAVIDRLDETVTLAGFVALDDAETLPSQTLGLRVGELEESAAVSLRVVFDRLQGHLTRETLRNLASRVRLLGRDPVDVAMEYLLREGLVEGFAEGGPG